MATFCTEYSKIFAGYKPATDNVFSWLKKITNTSKASVNYYAHLANKVVSEGIAIPENILADLQTAINLRLQAAELHAKDGTADHGHDHVIDVLQQILNLFCPVPPSPTLSACSLSSESTQSSTLDFELLSLQLQQQQSNNLTYYQQPQAQFYQQPFYQQEYAPYPYPMGESLQFCDYGHHYQYQQHPYEVYYQPGVHPSYQQPLEFQDPAILYMA
ncbi:hypothetical protein, variant [Exophiala sideris]|uniref:DUF6604 domain-containing protein n=1 Tax=Exophiala sideris TaxID=1016849 RepID=A0A0D1Z424_9EURO|nr:hypothetical protein PV11_03784 [Exophiala sideris]KIV81613.1 hypothetical protein, variant [Exophiala sideris]